MSININIWAVREVIVKKTAKVDKQRVYFDCWQTPTTVSQYIMASEDPLKAYKDWVLGMAQDVEEPIYSTLDAWENEEPTGYEIVNYEKEHVADLEDWVKQHEEDGYTIEVDAW